MPQLLYQTKYYIIKVSVSLPYILVPQPLMISSISNICLTQAVWFCQPPPPNFQVMEYLLYIMVMFILC